MSLDKSALKKRIDASKPSEILVLLVDSLDKNNYKNYQNEINSFIKKTEDYVITVMKR